MVDVVMMDERTWLNHNGHAPPRQPHATRAALLVTVIFCAAAVLNMRFAGDSPVSEEESGVRMADQMLPRLLDDDDALPELTSNTTLRVYKRTVGSLSPGEDAAFMYKYTGLVLNKTAQYHCGTFAENVNGQYKHTNSTGKGAKICAERAVSVAADEFEIHFFHSHVSADSTEIASMRAWILRWNALHHGSEMNATTFAKEIGGLVDGSINQRKQDGNETSPWEDLHVDVTQQPQTPMPSPQMTSQQTPMPSPQMPSPQTPVPSISPTGPTSTPTMQPTGAKQTSMPTTPFETEPAIESGASNWSTPLSFNEFTPQSVTFFTPDLTSFVREWKRAGIATMLRKYNSTESRYGVVYSGRIATPASGFIIEIIAYDVDHRFRSSFTSYQDNECGPGMEIHSANLTHYWNKNVYMATGNDLPGLLIAQITQPAQPGDDLLALGNYLHDSTSANVTQSVTKYPDDNCESADAWVKVAYAPGDYLIPIRTIANGALASEGASLSVASFQNEMNAMLDALMGCNKGYSRFVDWHIGIFVDGHGTSLDANAEYLCENKIGFHNGGQLNPLSPGTEKGWGSNWARGAAGMGVEFWAAYDGSVFLNATQLDYFSASGFSSHFASGSNEEYCDSTVLNAKKNQHVTKRPARPASVYSYEYSPDDESSMMIPPNATSDNDRTAQCSTLRKNECTTSSACDWKKSLRACIPKH